MAKYDKVLTEFANYSNPAIIVGGPHASLYYNDLLNDSRIDVIVTGEAGDKIVEICKNAVKNGSPKIVHCGYVDTHDVKSLDYTVALQYENATEIGTQLERGCPFRCSFCLVRQISSVKVRYRLIDDCIKEIEEAVKVMPHLKTVRIVDDCPSFKLNIFKQFMRKFIEKFPYLRINIQHLRADQVDKEMLLLLKKAHLRSLTLGVESANPEIFKLIDKGEALEQIEKVAVLVKKLGMRVTLAFVLGLPLSNYKREEDSLRFAKKIKPHEIYWNMCIPYKGSRIWDWFQKNGKIYTDRHPTTLIDSNLEFDRPCVETSDFNIYERERAWVRAVFETKSFRFRFSLLPRIFKLAKTYHLFPSVFYLFCNLHNLKQITRDILLNILEFFGLFGIVRSIVIYFGIRVKMK